MWNCAARLRRRRVLVDATLAFAVIVGCAAALAPATAQQAPAARPASDAPAPSWKSSPFHGVVGGDGNIIPCRCRFNGQTFKLGEKVCMQTHLGTVLAECDLQLNNTSWVPTSQACTIS